MIRCRELVVTLAGRRVLDHVNLEVARGETVALVGPNGAGKTTLLRCVLGLTRYSGDITVGGIDTRIDPVGARSRLGYLPQTLISADDSARGALAFIAALRGVPRAAVDAGLERVGLAQHARRPVKSFSTGMRQRLSLAAALLGEPDLLVLDEPTASLDQHGQDEVVALLRGLHAEGKSILLSSHRTEEVRALGSRVVAMDEGRVVERGPARAAWVPELRVLPGGP